MVKYFNFEFRFIEKICYFSDSADKVLTANFLLGVRFGLFDGMKMTNELNYE